MRGDLLAEAERKALPCYNNPHDWQDSERRSDRRRAIRKCLSDCRQLAWCEEQRREAQRDHGVTPGVWAGKYHPHRMLPAIPLAGEAA